MNLEEARNNIGAEVELDESTKPYTFIDDDEVLKAEYSIIKGSMKIFSCMNDGNVVVVSDDGIVKEWYLPKHLKLKPQNYKIHVRTEEESKEAQELFFELGYSWRSGNAMPKYNSYSCVFTVGKIITVTDFAEEGKKINAKQITIQDLRDMVAKKKPQKEMTWENALRAVADGKEVESYNDFHGQWWNISGLRISEITGRKKFRIAPQRITLNGEYTKEELLQKIGEME